MGFQEITPSSVTPSPIQPPKESEKEQHSQSEKTSGVKELGKHVLSNPLSTQQTNVTPSHTFTPLKDIAKTVRESNIRNEALQKKPKPTSDKMRMIAVLNVLRDQHLITPEKLVDPQVRIPLQVLVKRCKGLDPNKVTKYALTLDPAGRQKILTTLITIGKLLASHHAEENLFIQENLFAKDEKESTDSFILTPDKEIYIKGAPIGAGSYKEVSEAISLSSDEDLVMASMKTSEDRKEAQKETEMIQTLHDLGIDNIVPPYKRPTLDASDKVGGPKLVAVQTRLSHVDKVIQKVVEPNRKMKLIAQIGKDIATGLAGMHRAGYVHCDIKPDNILYDPGNKKAYINDFGSVIKVGDINGLGTPDYMPPETLRVIRVEDELEFMTKYPRAKTEMDSFSLGVSLFDLITESSEFSNKKLFTEANSQDEIETFIESKKTKLIDDSNRTGSQILDLCKNLIQLKPENRLSCEKVAIELDRILQREV